MQTLAHTTFITLLSHTHTHVISLTLSLTLPYTSSHLNPNFTSTTPSQVHPDQREQWLQPEDVECALRLSDALKINEVFNYKIV